MSDVLRIVLRPAHLRRTLTVAAIVGTWLTGFNQGDVVFAQHWTWGVGLQVFLNYLTPFVVANLGLLSRGKGPVA